MSRNDGGKPRLAAFSDAAAKGSPSAGRKFIKSGRGIFMLDAEEKWLLEGGLVKVRNGGRCGNYGVVCEDEASRNARIREARVDDGSGSSLGWLVCSVRMPSVVSYLKYCETLERYRCRWSC